MVDVTSNQTKHQNSPDLSYNEKNLKRYLLLMDDTVYNINFYAFASRATFVVFVVAQCKSLFYLLVIDQFNISTETLLGDPTVVSAFLKFIFMLLYYDTRLLIKLSDFILFIFYI